MPDHEEVLTFYEGNNLHTGEATPLRGKRIDDCIRYVGMEFDPTKGRSLYTAGEYVDDIMSRITTDEINVIASKEGYRYKITPDDLDIVAGYHWICMINNQDRYRELTVPKKGVVQYWKYLKETGSVKRSCDDGRIRPCRVILQRIGYITLLDKSYMVGWDNNGVAMKWGIGENHPRYSEYLTFVPQSVVQAVISDAQARSTGRA